MWLKKRRNNIKTKSKRNLLIFQGRNLFNDKNIEYNIKDNKNNKSNRKLERYGSIDKSKKEKNEIIKLLNDKPKIKWSF